MGQVDFIPHVLGGCQHYGRLETMVIPKGTVLLKLRKHGKAITAHPYETDRDLHVTIRSTFVDEGGWDDVEEEGG